MALVGYRLALLPADRRPSDVVERLGRDHARTRQVVAVIARQVHRERLGRLHDDRRPRDSCGVSVTRGALDLSRVDPDGARALEDPHAAPLTRLGESPTSRAGGLSRSAA